MTTIRTLHKSAIAGLCLTLATSSASATCFRGVNLAGAEFGDLGGTYGQNYIYPSKETIRYFADKGLNTIRLPFLWERLQPILGSDFDQDELKRLRETVDAARAEHLNIILDVHNYAYFAGSMIGSHSTTVADFADLWARLAKEFANQPDISFGLMNEPHDIEAETWLDASNQAIAAIRKTGAKNLVLVPGTIWTGAHSWFATTEVGNNAETMINIVDPGNNFAYEFHQYLDSNFSGTHDNCPRATDAVSALENVTAWLKENGKRGFLGEFGGSSDAACLKGMAAMVDYVNREKSVWLGWTYWAGGDWWPASEPLNIQPHDGKDRPQITSLLRPGLEATSCGEP
ncbi:glycoside hydrolase family 5 protein [Rhizobium sp. L1K21]|uniref:glycoside hydrolase family 5 protein n=1 Tax=Rhizobium sp. L1K21 TaxID=2954933 RepID=UPI002091F181|nr:glycoside hydrolase family 5 protein [Rhizobium sp. L1K21]MCO6185305.1 glycoside hydrolase family 5 protein [Rhizobium sp. L1K21]